MRGMIGMGNRIRNILLIAWSLLMEAWRRSRRRLRFEQWLLLALRCLVVLLVGLALARPIIDLASASVAGDLLGDGRTVYLLVDNGLAASASTSGAALSRTQTVASGQFDPGATGLERSKAAAIRIIGALEPSDRVALITLARPAASIVDPPTLDHPSVARMIERIPQTDAPTDLSHGLDRLASLLASERESTTGPAIVYVLSDFRAGSVNLEEAIQRAADNAVSNPRQAERTDSGRVATPDSAGESDSTEDAGWLARSAGERPLLLLALQPATEPLTNVQIVGLNPVRQVAVVGTADGADQVSILLQRTGDVSAAATSTLQLNSPDLRDIEPIPVRWNPGQTEARVIGRIPIDLANPGELLLEATIEPDALPRDNQFITAINLEPSLRVAVLDRPEFRTAGGRLETFATAQWIRRALRPADGSPIEVEDVDPAQLVPGTLRPFSAAVLGRPDLVSESGWAALGTFVDRGGLLWIIPPHDTDVARWPDAATETLRLSWRVMREPITADPISQPWRVEPAASAQPLLTMISGELAELLSAVDVSRVLPLEPGSVDASDVVLQLQSDVLRDAAPAISPPTVINGNVGLTANAPPSERGSAAGGAKAAEGTPLLIATTPPGARGLVIYLASSLHLDWTTLPTKPLMVALAQEIIRQGVAEARGQEDLRAGTTPAISVRPGAVALLDPNGRRIPLLSEPPAPADSASTSTATRELPANEMAAPDETTDTTGGSDSEAAGSQRSPSTAGLRWPSRPMMIAGSWDAVNTASETIDRVPVNIVPSSGSTDLVDEDAIAHWLAPAGDWQFIARSASAAGRGEDAATTADVSPPSGATDIEGGVDTLTAALTAERSRSDLSLILLFLAVFCAVAETALARWFSHARRATGVPSTGAQSVFSGAGRVGGGGSTAHRTMVSGAGSTNGVGRFADDDVGAPATDGRSRDGRDVPDLDRYVVQPSGHSAASEVPQFNDSAVPSTRATRRSGGTSKTGGSRP
ncbi:MAG: VWA domain-containing protein [Planctomycetota bacterium]